MFRILFFWVLGLALMLPLAVTAQDLPVRWDELLASDWQKALEKSNYTCLLSISVLEKHGAHFPIGSDFLHAQHRSREAAKREYVVVFPEYYFGQIFEAKYAEGTIAYPPDLLWDLLQATVDEIGRNGFKKIILYSTHGGNPHWLRYFVQAQLEKRRNYVLYYYDPKPDPAYISENKKRRTTPLEGDEHAGERETASMMAIRPDLVKLDRATSEDGADQKRLDHLPDFWTGVSWYARFPNHYAGKGEAATMEYGKWLTESGTERLAKAIKQVKEDTITPQIQEENYSRQLK